MASKTKRKNNIKINSTLDAEHRKTEEIFNKRKKSLHQLKDKLKIIKKEDENLQSKADHECTPYEINRKYNLRQEIQKINVDIHKIENNSEEIEYYLKTSDIMCEYFDKKNKKQYDNKDHKKSIIDFFNSNDDDEYVNSSSVEDSEESENINTSHIGNIIKIKKDFDKEDLFDKYMSVKDKKYIPKIKRNENDIVRCSTCDREKAIIKSEGLLVCPRCGVGGFIIIDSEKPNLREISQENAHYCYKRINHFNECLSQFQAKESTDIPLALYEKIKKEVNKMKINIESLDKEILKSILKKLNKSKYYEHAPYIINKLNNLPPPTMTRENEDKLRSMFKEIQGPFMEIRPDERKNFLSYNYVLYKMCELLELDVYLSCFPLLKSVEKLHNQDVLWEKICRKLRWHFIPTCT